MALDVLRPESQVPLSRRESLRWDRRRPLGIRGGICL